MAAIYSLCCCKWSLGDIVSLSHLYLCNVKKVALRPQKQGGLLETGKGGGGGEAGRGKE